MTCGGAVFAIVRACEGEYDSRLYQGRQDGTDWECDVGGIYDLDAQTLTTIFHKTHRYTVVPMDKVRDRLEFGDRNRRRAYTAVVQKAGGTKTV